MKTLFLFVLISATIGLEPSIPEEKTMIVPQAAKNLIKEFEGLRLTAYKDIAGNLSIGYGHFNATPPPCTNCMVITEDQADGMLENDLDHTLSIIQGHIKADVTDNQLSALLSFAFNLGVNALINSTLLKDLNNGNIQQAADSFLLWDHSHGAIIPGLARRRAAERKLFLTPDTEGVTDVVAGN